MVRWSREWEAGLVASMGNVRGSFFSPFLSRATHTNAYHSCRSQSLTHPNLSSFKSGLSAIQLLRIQLEPTFSILPSITSNSLDRFKLPITNLCKLSEVLDFPSSFADFIVLMSSPVLLETLAATVTRSMSHQSEHTRTIQAELDLPRVDMDYAHIGTNFLHPLIPSWRWNKCRDYLLEVSSPSRIASSWSRERSEVAHLSAVLQRDQNDANCQRSSCE